ncbi:MAG: DUF4282 domain-containing protein [Ornithinimicrobium sp.]
MATESKGFFSALFDLDFNHFITVKFVKLIYVVLMAVLFLSAIVYFLASIVVGFSDQGSPLIILFALFFIPLVTLVYLVILRIFMESVVVFFRIGENTAAMAAGATTGQQGVVRTDETRGESGGWPQTRRDDGSPEPL